jgi:integral membrane protein (TIGR01906 family)
MQKFSSIFNIVSGFIFALFILSFAIIFTLNFRLLYLIDIDALNITESSGFSEKKILENYDALINYNSIFSNKSLSSPSFEISETGRIHFQDVRKIFVFIQIIFFISFTILIFIISYNLFSKKKSKNKYLFLFLGGIFTLIMPAIFIIFSLIIGWEKFFIFFHKVFFRNDFWIFDANKDPIISILPDRYFMHCFIMIISIIIILGLISILLFKKKFCRFLGSKSSE